MEKTIGIPNFVDKKVSMYVDQSQVTFWEYKYTGYYLFSTEIRPDEKLNANLTE